MIAISAIICLKGFGTYWLTVPCMVLTVLSAIAASLSATPHHWSGQVTVPASIMNHWKSIYLLFPASTKA